jgi:hypothetical protein
MEAERDSDDLGVLYKGVFDEVVRRLEEDLKHRYNLSDYERKKTLDELSRVSLQ